jgi:uncharacterized protein (TIGR02246 family)
MTKKLAVRICALAALAVIGAESGPGPERPRLAPTGADPRLLSAIEKANTEFETAMTKSDIATIAAPYTADAVFVGPDGTATRGRVAIEALYRDRFAKSGPALEARIESQQLMLDDDVAYERGRGSITRLSSGQPRTDRARFLTVWQRQQDGGWKISRNIVLPAL